MKMHVKLAAALFAAAAVLTTSIPVMAAEYTTSDSVITLKTPDDTWMEIPDADTWVTLGNGNDTITLLHYSNGESLPPITIAGEHYSKVCQTVLSTRNEVFIITGSVVDATNFKAVRKAVQSAKINKYDTKQALGSTKNGQSSSGYEVVDENMTCYVISGGLNVRAGYSTSEAILGGLSYADEVKVTGVVKNNGRDAGWYRINYDGSIGFVSSNFVSDTKPEVQPEKETPKRTGNEVTLYGNSGQITEVYEYSDGSWFDDDGFKYAAEGAGQWSCSDGTHWYTDAPVQSSPVHSNPEDENYVQITLTNSAGDTVYAYQNNDGDWLDHNDVYYYAEGGGQWTDSNGNTWTTN